MNLQFTMFIRILHKKKLKCTLKIITLILTECKEVYNEAMVFTGTTQQR